MQMTQDSAATLAQQCRTEADVIERRMKLRLPIAPIVVQRLRSAAEALERQEQEIHDLRQWRFRNVLPDRPIVQDSKT